MGIFERWSRRGDKPVQVDERTSRLLAAIPNLVRVTPELEVLRDHLLSAGDPWGQHISHAIVIANGRHEIGDTAYQTSFDELHRIEAGVGPLAALDVRVGEHVASCIWRLGFVSDCFLKRTWSARRLVEVIERYARLPIARLTENIHVTGLSGRHIRALAYSPLGERFRRVTLVVHETKLDDDERRLLCWAFRRIRLLDRVATFAGFGPRDRDRHLTGKAAMKALARGRGGIDHEDWD